MTEQDMRELQRLSAVLGIMAEYWNFLTVPDSEWHKATGRAYNMAYKAEYDKLVNEKSDLLEEIEALKKFIDSIQSKQGIEDSSAQTRVEELEKQLKEQKKEQKEKVKTALETLNTLWLEKAQKAKEAYYKTCNDCVQAKKDLKQKQDRVSELELEVSELKKQLEQAEKDHNAELEQLRIGHRGVEKRLREGRRKALEQAEKDHKSELEQVQEQHRVELEQAQAKVSELGTRVDELTAASARAEIKHERFKTKYKSRCRIVYDRKVSEYDQFVDDAADMSLKYLDSLAEQEQGKEALEKAKAELDRTKPKADAYDKIKKARADRKGKGYNTVCRKQIAAIVLLKVFNKLSDTEIGKVLGMSRNTVAKYRKEAKAICEEYTGVEGGVFTKQVAKKFELPEGTIRSILDTYGIRYQKKDGRILSDKKKPRGQLQKLGVKSTHFKRTKNAQNF